MNSDKEFRWKFWRFGLINNAKSPMLGTLVCFSQAGETWKRVAGNLFWKE